MPEVAARWTGGAQCVATGSGGHTVVMDAPEGRVAWEGFKPAELLLAALLGCIGVDFGGILRKQRQQVVSLSATARGEQDHDPPWAFRRIDVVFTVRGVGLDERAVQRALDLAADRYCSVGATLSGVATITHRAIVESEPGAKGEAPDGARNGKAVGSVLA